MEVSKERTVMETMVFEVSGDLVDKLDASHGSLSDLRLRPRRDIQEQLGDRRLTEIQ